MSRVQLSLMVGVLLAVGGCAQQPLKNDKAVAARAAAYGVSPQLFQMASNYGYLPQMRAGKPVFCRAQEVTGTSIGMTQCFDPTQLEARLKQESRWANEGQRGMEKTFGACSSKLC